MSDESNEPTTFDLYRQRFIAQAPAKAPPTITESTHDLVMRPLIVEWVEPAVPVVTREENE
jgi:hypothetical protein